MKETIDSLSIILAVENTTLDNCHLVAQLLLQEKAEVAYGLLEELNAQIAFTHMGDNEYGYSEIKG